MNPYTHDLGNGERFRAGEDRPDEWWFYGRTVQDWGGRYPVSHYVPCEPALWTPETGWVRFEPATCKVCGVHEGQIHHDECGEACPLCHEDDDGCYCAYGDAEPIE